MQDSYIIVDESFLDLVPSVIGGYARFGVEAAWPVLVGFIGLFIFLYVLFEFLS